MRRRSFLKAVASVAPTAVLHDLMASSGSAPEAASVQQPVKVIGAGEDRFGDPHSLGFSSIAFKVTTKETAGGLFVIEHTHLLPGGPPLHLHWNQEEFFYLLEGTVVFQVGDQRGQLRAGECVLAPRRVPHTFSSIGESRLLIAFTPAGKMEDYFRDAEKHRDLAADPEFMGRYDMKMVGPSPFRKS